MKTKYLNVVPWMLAGIVAAESYAIPSMTNKCRNLPQINHPANGAGILFDEECKTAFVLPPEAGTAKLTTIARNANLNFCPSVLTAGKTSENLIKSANTISERLYKMIEDYSPLEQKLKEAGDKVIAADAELTKLNGQLTAAETRKATELSNLSSAKSSLEICQVTGGNCTDAQKSVDEAKAKVITALQEYNALAEKKPVLEANLSSTRAKKLAVESEYTTAIANLNGLFDQILKINNSVMDLYKAWAPIEGATAQIVYRVEWGKILKAYAAENPELKDKGIVFSPVPVVDGRFFATTRLSSESDLAALPAVLSAVLPGSQPYGIANLGQNIHKIEAGDTDAARAEAAPTLNEKLLNFSGSATSGAGAAVSGQVRLSLAGACPYFPEGVTSNPGKTDIDSQELTAHMVVNGQLDYDVKVHRKYRASFNLSKVTERIEEVSKKKRWFFTSEDAHNLIVNTDASSWFNITFDADASDMSFTGEEQIKITNEVKADLVKRTLDQIAVVTGKLPEVPDMTKSGFQSGAGNLTCASWYCGGFNWVLGVADGFFGTHTATSKYKETNNSWTGDSVNQMKVIRRSQILTFVPEDKLPSPESH